MSTRSGRRIHGSIHEPEVAIQEEIVGKSVKKTRGKRAKDAIEVLETTAYKSKKRNNYVSYPSDEEIQGVPEVPKDKEDEPIRMLRKTALKEQDLNISSSAFTEVADEKKPARLTRRTKKFAENHEDDPDQNVQQEVPETVVEIKGKKNKKKKSKTEILNENGVAAIPKKKSKRKKKKSNQESNAEVKNSTLNGSKMSIDSFHSAAGSPVHVDDENQQLNTTFDKSPEKPNIETKNISQTSDRKRRRSSHVNNDLTSIGNTVTEPNSKKISRQNSTFEVVEVKSSIPNVSVKENTPNKKRLTKQNSTLEMIELESANEVEKENTPNKRRLTRQNTFEITEVKVNTTFEKDAQKGRRSSVKNGTFDAINSPAKETKVNSTFDKNKSGTPSKLNTTFEKDSRRRSLRLSSVAMEENSEPKLNGTYDKEERQSDALNSTFDKETKSNLTFDKDKSGSNKSSLITSDDTGNLTFDKSDERISITSDDSRIENTTPVLIESSLDESRMNMSGNKKSPRASAPTPMKREGTFTKEESDVDPKVSMESIRTPTKHMSLATPGSTPFLFSKSGQKERTMLNVTRSIEKSRLSLADVPPSTRTTKVMFCSPVNNPVVVAQQKRKVIKSNLKGSNKSFVFEETASSPVRAAPRKRSYTHNDVEEARAKRFRQDDQQQSVDRLSKPRTSTTSNAKPTEPTTPSKRIPTPSKSKSESKVSRTKLPNFAALHQKRFQKMESLDECQERKARRARQLLTPSAAINVLERSSPRGTEQAKVKDAKKPEPKEKKTETKVQKKVETKPESKGRSEDQKSERPEKDETLSKAKPEEPVIKPDAPKAFTLDSLKRGYTRFGFKMNIGVNPFNVPSTAPSKEKPKDAGKPKNGLTRQATHPSLAGATGARRVAARQLVMREKSFTSERRDATRTQSRTVIKGVRTNRRFELQMQMRNIS